MIQQFLHHAKTKSADLAVTNESDSVTFGNLAEHAQRLAMLLGNGTATPHVILALPGGPKFTAVVIAALLADAIVAPVPDKVSAREAASYLRLLNPDFLVVESIEKAEPFLANLKTSTVFLVNKRPYTDEINGLHRILVWDDIIAGKCKRLPVIVDSQDLPQDTRVIQFTSGSTGDPKGVLISLKNLQANLKNNQKHLNIFRGQNVFCPIPQFHAMGFAVVLEHIMNGTTVHLANRFMPGDALKRMQQHQCTAILASPNYYKMLLHRRVLTADKVDKLRSMTIGTANVDRSLVADLRRVFPYAVIHVRYGLSESVGALTMLDLQPGQFLDHPGLVGPLVANTHIAPGLLPPEYGEPKEIRVKSEANAIGHLTNVGEWAPLVERQGYLPTGDLAYLDTQGNLHLRGRLTNFLKCNGFRIDPNEIETVLREIPGIQEAVVVGVPDPVSGQSIVACLELLFESGLPEKREIVAICKRELATYKIPRRFLIFKSLARTPAGKPDRKRILGSINDFAIEH